MGNSISLHDKRKLRNRKALKRKSYGKLRLTVFRSSRHIYGQIIDDVNKVTLVSVSSIEKNIKDQKKSKSELSTLVAESLAKKAQEKKITKVYFDRGIYKYHGRVKIFAETLRKNGMEF